MLPRSRCQLNREYPGHQWDGPSHIQFRCVAFLNFIENKSFTSVFNVKKHIIDSHTVICGFIILFGLFLNVSPVVVLNSINQSTVL